MRILLALTLVSAGCGAVAPSPSQPASPTPSRQPTTTPTTTPTATPAASPIPWPTQPAKGDVTDLAVEVHRLPGTLTAHVSAFISLGDGVLWSGGPDREDANLYLYRPGAGEPELLYVSLERDVSIASVAGSSAGYAFTAERWVGGEPRGWRLWFLPLGQREPIEIDRSTDDRLIAPTIALNDRWLAWEVVRGSLEEPINELRYASVADPLTPTTLLSYPGRDVYMQFPSLWQDELWYGIADNDWVALTEKPRVELIDLARPALAPAEFGAAQRAFMPAPARDVVAWKGGGTDELAALTSGGLMLYWRADGQIDELPLPGPQMAAERISYPSVGNRFVAWWDDIGQRFYVYDLRERQFRRIAEYDWTGDERVTRPSLSGDLLVYTHYVRDGERYLEWIELPD